MKKLNYRLFKKTRLSNFCLQVGLLVGILIHTNAQNATDTKWYFGESIYNLVFDLNGRGVTLDSLQSPGYSGIFGGVTLTDQFTNNLLFYSDGNNIFDASHQNILIPPSNLNGVLTKNNSVVASPIPGRNKQYYLFLNSRANITYTTLNADAVGNGNTRFPLGGTEGTINVPLDSLKNPSEGMIVLSSNDHERFWLLSQDTSTYDLSVTAIDDSLTNIQKYSFTALQDAIIHFVYNRLDSLLVTATRSLNQPVLLWNFNPDNGEINYLNPLTILDPSQPAVNQIINGLEFSPDGTKLYVSFQGSPGFFGKIVQVDFSDNFNVRSIVIDPSIYQSFALKRGPDNRIYHLYQTAVNGPMLLGRILNSDSVADSVSYESRLFDVDFESRQFPAFAPAYAFQFDTLDFTYAENCGQSYTQNPNNYTKFFPNISPTPHRIFWNFGDGQGVGATIPSHLFSASGTYNVRMTAEINGIFRSVVKSVVINPAFMGPDLGEDTTICVDEILTLDAGNGVAYKWSTGDTTRTLAVDTGGTYWVAVMNQDGCFAVDEIVITEYQVSNQKYNQWYFGDQAAIQFIGRDAIPIIDNNRQSAIEGCGTFSDINGNLLFYTNGQTVWNKDHEIMAEDIGGDSSSIQNTLIMPFRNDNTLFYVFTTQDVDGNDNSFALKYTVVDLKTDTVLIKNVNLVEWSTERITGTGFDNDDHFIVGHEFGNNTFISYLIDQQGLNNPIYSHVGMPHSFFEETHAGGQMKVSSNLSQIAVNIPDPDSSFVEIFDFEDGIVSNPRSIPTGEPDLYGLEFSPSGQKLYLTATGNNSKLIQYDLDSLSAPNSAQYIDDSKYIYSSGSDIYGTLQIGPNETIYMATDNVNFLGTINSPNLDDDNSGFNEMGLDLMGPNSRLGLPNFYLISQSSMEEPSLSYSENCLGEATLFNGKGRDSKIETYLWDFGDGSPASVQQSISHTYDSAGMYVVQLRLSNRCDTDTILMDTVEIFEKLEKPTVPGEVYLCNMPVTLEAWPTDNPQMKFEWSTGDTTRTITVNEGAIIDITIIDRMRGCFSDTTVYVSDVRPEFNFADTIRLCQNNDSTLDPGISARIYEWFIDGVLVGMNRTYDINTASSGMSEYVLRVTNSLGCIRSDTVQVIIEELPNITITTDTTTLCGNFDGQINFDFDFSLGTELYRYEIYSGISLISSGDNLATDTMVAGLSSGVYSVRAFRQGLSCSYSEVALIADGGISGFAINARGINGCLGEGMIQIVGLPTAYNFSITNEEGLLIGESNQNDTSALSGLDTGTYFIAVTNMVSGSDSGCVLIDTAKLELLAPQVPFDFDSRQDICGISIVTVSDSTNALYSWSGPEFGPSGIVGSADGDTITVDKGGTYTVTASDPPAYCPRTVEIVVNLNDNLSVEIQKTMQPCLGYVTLSAIVTGGSGNYYYVWSDNSSIRDQTTVTTSGEYTVAVTDLNTGCMATALQVDVVIYRPVSVYISQQPDCANPNAVFLEAIATSNSSDTSYQWIAPNGQTLMEFTSIISVTTPGEYRVIVRDASGICSDTATSNVQLVPITQAELLLDPKINFCPLDPESLNIDLDPGIFFKYEWYLQNDTSILSTDRVYTSQNDGTYLVKLYNGFTCITDTVTVKIDCTPTIIAPNAFTPNEDGLNDEFFVYYNAYVDNFEILIYSRWGEQLFRSKDIAFKWDGMYKGGLLPPDTYTYLVRFSSMLDPGSEIIKQFGTVTLIR